MEAGRLRTPSVHRPWPAALLFIGPILQRGILALLFRTRRNRTVKNGCSGIDRNSGGRGSKRIRANALGQVGMEGRAAVRQSDSVQ